MHGDDIVASIPRKFAYKLVKAIAKKYEIKSHILGDAEGEQGGGACCCSKRPRAVG